MALAIQLTAMAMLEEDPEKALEHIAKAEEAMQKFKDAIIEQQDPPELNMERLVP